MSSCPAGRITREGKAFPAPTEAERSLLYAALLGDAAPTALPKAQNPCRGATTRIAANRNGAE
jgi:hypothetical protein